MLQTIFPFWRAQSRPMTNRWALWESDLIRAKRVQTGFFPQIQPVTRRIEFYAESRAALHVGGDYYDYLQHNSEHVTFVIGDVCNKGVTAALLMAMLRKVFRTGIKILDMPFPKDILAYANTDMYDELNQATMFATGFIGQFSADKRSLRFANAGHSPVVYCPVDGPAEILRADNVPIGVLQQASFVEKELPLRAGDILVIATDGLAEIDEESFEHFGYGQLLQRIETMRNQPIDQFGRSLFHDLAQLNPTTHQDDQTLLIVRGVE